MTELQSLKNPTRLITVIAFIAFIIYNMGTEGLTQILPGVPQAYITAIFGAAAYAVTQYGTEKRVVRAEELKDEEFKNELDSESAEVEEDDIPTLSDSINEGA